LPHLQISFFLYLFTAKNARHLCIIKTSTREEKGVIEKEMVTQISPAPGLMFLYLPVLICTYLQKSCSLMLLNAKNFA
jgi:hypothetical protein